MLILAFSTQGEVWLLSQWLHPLVIFYFWLIDFPEKFIAV